MSKLHPVPSQMDTINALLQRKLANPLDDTLNDEFLSHTITFFTSNGTDCMWCKSPRITSELFWLFSLNDNDHLEWFKRVTTKCLQQCRACIEAYYKHKSMIMHRFRSIYNPDTLQLFTDKIHQFDIHRLSAPLSSLEEDTSRCRSPEVMHALFEVLLCPRWIKSHEIGALFERVLVKLIHSKRMLRVTENLGGVVFCALHSNAVLRKWSTTILLEGVKTECSNDMIDDEYSWQDILTRYHALLKHGSVAKDELLRSLALCIWWTPQELIVKSADGGWSSVIDGRI